MKVLHILQSYYWRLALGILLIPTCNIAITQKRIADINQFVADLKAKRITNVAQIETRQKQLKAGLSSRELQSRQLKDMDKMVQTAITALTPPKVPTQPVKALVESIRFTNNQLRDLVKTKNLTVRQDIIQRLYIKLEEFKKNLASYENQRNTEDYKNAQKEIKAYENLIKEFEKRVGKKPEVKPDEEEVDLGEAFEELFGPEEEQIVPPAISGAKEEPARPPKPEVTPKVPPVAIPEELKTLEATIRENKNWLNAALLNENLKITQEGIQTYSTKLNEFRKNLESYADSHENTIVYQSALQELKISEDLIKKLSEKIKKEQVKEEKKPAQPVKALVESIRFTNNQLRDLVKTKELVVRQDAIQALFAKLSEFKDNLNLYEKQQNTADYKNAQKEIKAYENLIKEFEKRVGKKPEVKPDEEEVDLGEAFEELFGREEERPEEPAPKIPARPTKEITIVLANTPAKKDAIQLYKEQFGVDLTNKNIKIAYDLIKEYQKQNVQELKTATGLKPTPKSLKIKDILDALKNAAAILAEEKIPEEEIKLIEEGKKLAPEQKLSDEISERVKTVLAQIDTLSADSSKDDIDTIQNSLKELNDKYAQYKKIAQEDNKVLRERIDGANHNFNIKGLEILNQIAAPILADIKEAKDALPNIQIKDTTFANFNKLILFSGYFKNLPLLYDAQAALNGYMADATQKILLLEDIRTPGRLLNKLNQINTQYTNAILKNPVLKERQDQYEKLFKEKEATLRKNLEQQIDAAITNGTIQRWLDNVRWAFITDLVVKMENLRKKENINIDDTLLPAYLVPYYEQLDIAKNKVEGALRQQIIATQKFMVDGFKQYMIDFLIRMRELTGLEELHIAVQAKDDPTAREKVKKILPQSTTNLSKMLADLKDLNAWDESNQLDRRIEFEATRSFAYILAAHDAFEKAIFYNYTTWEQIWAWIKYILFSVAGGTRLGDRRPGTNFEQYKWYVSAIDGVETALQNIIKLYYNLITSQIGKNASDTDPRPKGIGPIFESGQFSPIQTYRYPINGKTLHYVPENIFMKNGKYIYEQRPITINTGIFQGLKFQSPRITGKHIKPYAEIMDTFKLQLQEAWGISPEDAATVVTPDNLLDEGARVDVKGNPVL